MPLPRTPRPFDDVVKSAELSDDGLFRWSLTRCWGKGAYVCWIMLNPSTADAVDDDPTIRRCMDWSRRWGYGGLKVVNLWPYRTSSPNKLRHWLATTSYQELDRIDGENVRVIEAIAKEAGRVVAAWGCHGGEQGDDVAACLEFEGVQLHCLGLTKGGHPIHPMARGKHRIPDDVEPRTFHVPESYA